MLVCMSHAWSAEATLAGAKAAAVATIASAIPTVSFLSPSLAFSRRFNQALPYVRTRRSSRNGPSSASSL
ncbi:Early nodulin 93 [Zea mays]|uniref:Early nodulin 93 n=1 Tax=Zea mays TaxID=4577 RepID=A0A1D6NVS6_MAIZE|nr:Early nodulin 93 [Zea mays]